MRFATSFDTTYPQQADRRRQTTVQDVVRMVPESDTILMSHEYRLQTGTVA
jgi:hypothetical protein